MGANGTTVRLFQKKIILMMNTMQFQAYYQIQRIQEVNDLRESST
jgi:hypothetical protein